MPSLSLEIFVMIFKRKILSILFFLLLFSQNSYSQDQNVLDILETIQKDLKTLEKAVYSDSVSLNSNTTIELDQNTEDVLNTTFIKVVRIRKSIQ